MTAPTAKSMQEQVHVYFSGRVQGVGFRFTARTLAARYQLSGWVRNLPDGRVELLAQGLSKDVIEFLNGLRSEFKGYILNEDVSWNKADTALHDFAVRF